MSQPISLNDPIEICGLKIKNRLCKSAMSEQLGGRNGEATKALETLYKTWAQGGFGLQITGNVMIDARHCGEPRNVIVENRNHIEALTRWAAAAQENQTYCWVQLNHPGKQAPKHVDKQPISPSAVPLGQGMDKIFNVPRVMTEDDIADVIQRFTNATLICQEAGFSGIQIHGAHGYLISQFLSSHHNRRTDRWGGSLENRMRFVIEVYRAMRAAVGKTFPIGIKLNSADFQRGGFTEQESMTVVQTLESEGIDLIEISGGNYEAPAMMRPKKRSTIEREAYFLEYAETLRSHVQVPLVVTGGFRTAKAMSNALASGALDMVGIARPVSVFPNLANQLLTNPATNGSYAYPSTGIKFIDKIAVMDINWHEHQLKLLSSGQPPNPSLSPWWIAWRSIRGILKSGSQKRRA